MKHNHCHQQRADHAADHNQFTHEQFGHALQILQHTGRRGLRHFNRLFNGNGRHIYVRHNLAQRLAHFAHAFIAVFHAEGHGFFHDAHQILAGRLFKGTQFADGKPVWYAILAIARNSAGEHEVQHTAQRIHLAGGCYLAGQLLGRHQCGRRAGPVRFADTEIHQHRLVFAGKQNVGRFDVAMEERYRPFVQVMNRHQNLHYQFNRDSF